jgi:hypothetical protein
MKTATALILVGGAAIGVFFFTRQRQSQPREIIVQNPSRNDAADILSAAGSFASGIGDIVEAFSDEGEKQAGQVR